MTYREKLQIEHPESIKTYCLGGCDGCPGDYGYEIKKSCIGASKKKCRKCWDREIPGTEVKEMTRDDLKDGMVCERRDGELMMWFNGMLCGLKSYCSGIGEDLKNIIGYSDLDIIRVYRTNGLTLTDMLVKRHLTLIWERKELKEMTLADIERELGYPVKIVSAEGQEA